METALRCLHRVQPDLQSRSQPPALHQCTESRFDLLEGLFQWILLWAKCSNLNQMFQVVHLIEIDLSCWRSGQVSNTSLLSLFLVQGTFFSGTAKLKDYFHLHPSKAVYTIVRLVACSRAFYWNGFGLVYVSLMM